jgi:hypothetical protein
MTHPLQDVMSDADGFLLVGDSAAGRFPATSFHAYTVQGRRFFTLDLGGLRESRGPSGGRPILASIDELPDDHGDLAILWVHPHRARECVDLVHGAGFKRVWFSFQTGHPDAVARARELGLDVVEIGRCPVYYASPDNGACKAHTLLTRLSGTWARPPQTDAQGKKRELW